MAEDSRSWIGALVGRAGPPAAIGIALGALSFAAGLLEPVALSNRKLALGTVLFLGGLLWQAGSNWRFQHSEDGWPTSIFSVYLLAVLFWAGCLMMVVWLAFWPGLVALPAKRADTATVIEIRDVTMEKGTTLASGNAEWRIRATVLSHAPSLEKGSTLVYLNLDVAEGSPKTSVGFRNFSYSTVWLTDGTGVFVVNTVGPMDHAPTLTWTVFGYSPVAQATLAEPAR